MFLIFKLIISIFISNSRYDSIEDNNAESEMARIKQVEEILSAYMKEIEEKLQK